MPRNPERAASLKQFAAEEVDQFRKGEVPRLSTIYELRDRFGYPYYTHVTKVLTKAGIKEARKQAIKDAVKTAVANRTEFPALPRGTERNEALAEFVQEEIVLAQAGVIDHVSTHEELAQMFGYQDEGNINKQLLRRSIRSRRNATRDELNRKRKEKEGIVPSRDWAWMLGALSAGGHTSTDNDGVISMASSEDDQTLETFKTLGERLFGVNAQENKRLPENSTREETTIRFYSLAFTKLIGNLRTDKWAETIRERHSWIREDPRFIWGFLEGYFNRSGNIYVRGENKGRLVFHTSLHESANYISELLNLVHIQSPRLSTYEQTREGIDGVVVYNLHDIQVVAKNIHSTVSSKESKLEYFRNVKVPEYKVTSTDDEIIQEWIRLTKLLGHTPSSSDITKLRNEGKTRYHLSAFTYRFGNERFGEAKKKLERIVFERETSETLKKYEENTGVEIRYVPKLKRDFVSEEQARNRLDQIIKELAEIAKQSKGQSLLFGPDGKSFKKID